MSAAAIVLITLLLLIAFCLLVLIGRVTTTQTAAAQQKAAVDATSRLCGVFSVATLDLGERLSGPLATLVDGISESNTHLQALDDHFTAGPITLGHKVTVHTKKPDDQSIHGLLFHEYPDRLELVDAHFVGDPEKKVIPGVVRIATGHIAFRQDHSGTVDASGS